MASKEKKPLHHVEMTERKRALLQQMFGVYDIETADDIQDALKDLLGGTIKEMMEVEMDDHLGYGKSERTDRSKQTDYRNGTKPKQVNSSYGSMTINVPQDRQRSVFHSEQALFVFVNNFFLPPPAEKREFRRFFGGKVVDKKHLSITRCLKDLEDQVIASQERHGNIHIDRADADWMLFI